MPPTREYLAIVERVIAAGVERNLSLKLTQLGLDVDRATATDNLRRILEATAGHGFFVRIDMEDSSYTDATLTVLETVWGLGYHDVGTVLQSALRRTPADLDRLNAIGSRVRLVKGAYREPAAVAYQRMNEVDEALRRPGAAAARRQPLPGIRHPRPGDDRRGASAAPRERGIAADRYEFQMLYGIRRDFQTALLAEGYRVRVYVPFGKQWFPYFMRRLGERPANVGFVLKGIVAQRMHEYLPTSLHQRSHQLYAAHRGIAARSADRPIRRRRADRRQPGRRAPRGFRRRRGRRHRSRSSCRWSRRGSRRPGPRSPASRAAGASRRSRTAAARTAGAPCR